jgi:microcystin-dependent protein
MSWPTGDTLSGQNVALRFILPNTDWIGQALLGSTDYLQSVFAWDDVGDILPSTAALVFQKAFRTARIEALAVGQILIFPADNMQYIGQNPANGPSQYQKCEGQSLLKADFPDLFAVIGTTFGGDPTHFSIPDMRGRVVVDAGTGSGLTPYALGDEFGEEAHTLSQAEMPSHSHSYSGSLTSTADIVPTEPVLIPNPIPAATGNTGGGGAHENRQPSVALFYYIQVTP